MVFYISVCIVAALVIWGAVDPDKLSTTATDLLTFTTNTFGWFFLIVTFGFLIFSLYLAFSRFGNIKLGQQGDEPEYSNVSWFAMLFSAGMGIGLVFWGVAEPIDHYINPPVGVAPNTADSARAALRYSFFHWGLQPWAIYAIIGLALAYFKFRKNARGLISATFYPLLGERVNGPIGKTIDVLSILATVFGVATSLGLGTLQINGGLHQVFGVPVSIVIQISIIVVVTVLFLISATTGLDKGIKILSNANLLIALALLILTFVFGPTFFILDTFTTTLGDYLENLVHMSLHLTPFTQSKWIANWTLFYWAWWIAWAPFVGMFIARVSKGRTIKEFIVGVLIVPSIFSFIWFTVFGGTALHFQMFNHANIVQIVQKDVTSALFVTLSHLPLGGLISVIAIVLIITFFVTSADSATFVLGMMSSKGNLNPSNVVKLIWGVLQSLIALVLLLSGGLKGLQTASIIAALPFSIIMVFMCISMYRAFQTEYLQEKERLRERERKLDSLLHKATIKIK